MSQCLGEPSLIGEMDSWRVYFSKVFLTLSYSERAAGDHKVGGKGTAGPLMALE